MYKLASADGAYLPWAGSTDADMLVQSIWGDPASTVDSADSIYALGGKLYLTFKAANKIAVLDASSGKLLKTLDVPTPTSLWVRSESQVYVLSGVTKWMLSMPGRRHVEKAIASPHFPMRRV